MSIKIFLIPFGLGCIGWLIYGLSKGNLTLTSVATGGMYVTIWAACFGLLVCAIAYVRTDFLGPLNYQEQWRLYFKKMNFVPAMLCICLFMLAYAIILDIVLWMI